MRSLILFVFIASFGMGACQSNAQGIVVFGPKETKIIGVIPYSVIGKYKAQFGAFQGKITLDEKSQRVQSVYMEIEADSIRSNCPWCDKIARSRRLLYASRYPTIIFKSDKIIHDESGYNVKGVLAMHGIRKRMVFPFKEQIIIDQTADRKMLDVEGSWVINRKDFNIIWSKYLDHGGIVVGDNLTVYWRIKIYLNS